MSELPIPQLIDLQADHLDLATRFKQVDEILLLCIDGNVADPQRVPVRRLDTLWAISTAARGLCRTAGICIHLVHVGKIELDSLPHELLAMLLHCLIDTLRVLELDVCKVAPDVTLAAAYLSDRAAVLEKLDEFSLLGLRIRPSHPDRATTLWFRAALWFVSAPRWRRSPVAIVIATVPTATVVSVILTASARLPPPYRVAAVTALSATASARWRTTPRRAADCTPVAARPQNTPRSHGASIPTRWRWRASSTTPWLI